jgi:hypothetical protein
VALVFALLCDISHHLNDANTNFKGQKKLISHLFGAARIFLGKAETILATAENC